jgi:hypothetical protein
MHDGALCNQQIEPSVCSNQDRQHERDANILMPIVMCMNFNALLVWIVMII